MDDNALAGLQNSINLANETAQSWDGLWTTVINPTAPLWIALVQLGLLLAGLSLVYLAVTSAKEALEKQSWSELIQMFIWPIVILFFLSGSGKLLSQFVLGIRQIGYKQVTAVLELQANGAQLGQALANNNISNIAQQQIQQQYSSCIGYTGTQLNDCWTAANANATQIVTAAETQAGTSLPELRTFAANIAKAANVAATAQDAAAASETLGVIGSSINSVLIGIIQVVLGALQWAFVNVLEVALILTALFAPIAMGLSLLPLQGRPIITWLIGYISLFGLQLGYNIIVGLVAVVLDKAGAVTASDIGFLLFMALFAPLLATAIAGGGGLALNQAAMAGTKAAIGFVGDTIGATTRHIAKSSGGGGEEGGAGSSGGRNRGGGKDDSAGSSADSSAGSGYYRGYSAKVE